MGRFPAGTLAQIMGRIRRMVLMTSLWTSRLVINRAIPCYLTAFEYWIFFSDRGNAVLQRPISHWQVFLYAGEVTFFTWWDPRFIVLILTSTVADYFLGILLETSECPSQEAFTVVSLVVNLRISWFLQILRLLCRLTRCFASHPPSSVVCKLSCPLASASTRSPVFPIRSTSTWGR
jgi:hypothetical protein